MNVRAFFAGGPEAISPRRPLSMLVLCCGMGIILASCDRGTDTTGPDPRSGCRLEVPTWLKRATPAVVKKDADVPVAFAVRDGSLTVAAVCLEEPELPSRPPRLREGGRVLDPGGGQLIIDPHPVDLVIYPPTKAPNLTLEFGGRSASLTFPETRRSSCTIQGNARFRIRACESIFVADWNTQLEVPANRLELADVRLVDVAAPRNDLGFFFIDAHDRQGSLTLRFGFRRPSGYELRLVLSELYVNEDGRPVLRDIERPLTDRVTLSRLN